MAEETIFSKIIRREIPSDIVYQDDLVTAFRDISPQEGIAEDGYRLIMNTNRHGGQEVYHIHMHLLGGRPLGPMLTHKGL